jgi:hypothetical protein
VFAIREVDTGASDSGYPDPDIKLLDELEQPE